MKKVYPVIFTQTEDVVLVEVPDLEILTEGKNMADAIDMARDAIGLKGISLEDDSLELSEPSKLEEINLKNGTFSEEGKGYVSFVDIDFNEYRRKIDNRTVRRNVSLPAWLDYAAEKASINVSRVLQEALQETLGLQKNK